MSLFENKTILSTEETSCVLKRSIRNGIVPRFLVFLQPVMAEIRCFDRLQLQWATEPPQFYLQARISRT